MVLAHGRQLGIEHSSVSTQKTSAAKRNTWGWLGPHTCPTCLPFPLHILHSFTKKCPRFTRNMPAVGWVLRPNARPAARSARMIDMVLLGCCVSGRCVCGFDRLARWLNLQHPPHARFPSLSIVFLCPSFFSRVCPHRYLFCNWQM